jgi:hypothetical protein
VEKNHIMNTIQLDKNYRIIPCYQKNENFGCYSDKLTEIVNRLLRLQKKGKISSAEAKLILKFYISKNLKKEFETSLNSYI